MNISKFTIVGAIFLSSFTFAIPLQLTPTQESVVASPMKAQIYLEGTTHNIHLLRVEKVFREGEKIPSAFMVTENIGSRTQTSTFFITSISSELASNFKGERFNLRYVATDRKISPENGFERQLTLIDYGHSLFEYLDAAGNPTRYVIFTFGPEGYSTFFAQESQSN